MALNVSMMGLSWIGVLALGALAEVVGAATTVLIAAIVSGTVSLAILEQKQRRFLRERPGDSHPLPFPTRQAIHPSIGERHAIAGSEAFIDDGLIF